ncbi:hypothetical protein Q3G72_029624 [Acer saccharum]|nr:hypothetical protein Q3G72_029624 [Acer saccharum]
MNSPPHDQQKAKKLLTKLLQNYADTKSLTKVTVSGLLSACLHSSIAAAYANCAAMFRTHVKCSMKCLNESYSLLSIRDSHSTADNTSTLKGSAVAFITNAHKHARTHIGVTNYALATTFLTKSSNGNTRLLPAHNQTRMMLHHAFCYKLLPADS